jgi:phage-Barnase-EndoU-ColicinE5/D-RelE like nuclease2
MAKRTRRITDYTGRVVRLTDERLRHIHEHSEMVRQERRIREVLQSPDVVWTSHKDASVHLYYRHYARSPAGSKHLLVAVKILEKDAFIITAFFTDEIKGGKQIWPKESPD